MTWVNTNRAEDDAVGQIAPPEPGLFLDAPEPLEAPFPHAHGRPPDGPGLEIDGGAELRADRDLSGDRGFAAARDVL